MIPTPQNTVGRISLDDRGRANLRRWLSTEREYLVHFEDGDLLLRVVT